MLAFLAENIAPVMFLSLILILVLGYPVAFSLGATGLIFFVIGVELAPYSDGAISLSWPLLNSMPGRIYDIMRNDTLLAIPFFTFMGLILERSGMAEDLLDTVGQLFGEVRGGLAFAVIFVGALLAATTGVVAASVISMGLISLPIMLRYGYDRQLSAGVIAASGTLAQIVPPSLVLIVLADQLGRSVDDMYKAAILPGIGLAALYALYVFCITLINPKAAPGLPSSEVGYRMPDGSRGLTTLGVVTILSTLFAVWVLQFTPYSGLDAAVVGLAAAISFALTIALLNRAWVSLGNKSLLTPLTERVTFVMVPPLLLIFLVLGTILIGVATPTEGGAMGAVGAMLLAAAKRFTENNERRFSMKIVGQAAESTAKLAAFVMFILVGARIFSLTFYGVNGHIWVEHLLTALPGGMYGFLIFVNVVVFLLSFFLDFFELAFIIVPLLKPVAEAIFASAPEAIEIAKAFGFAVVTERDANGIEREVVADVTPFVVWFGVLLAINMQTSFMHPPFGFALHYLRSVAPKEPYKDRVTGQLTAPVSTPQIYWGAVPFLCIQLVMVAIVLMLPQMTMHHRVKPPAVERAQARDAVAPPVSGDGFSLPPVPPHLEGAPPYPADAPKAPTLNMLEGPSFDLPERKSPQ